LMSTHRPPEYYQPELQVHTREPVRKRGWGGKNDKRDNQEKRYVKKRYMEKRYMEKREDRREKKTQTNHECCSSRVGRAATVVGGALVHVHAGDAVALVAGLAGAGARACRGKEGMRERERLRHEKRAEVTGKTANQTRTHNTHATQHNNTTQRSTRAYQQCCMASHDQPTL
jgi:hypothetical protein